MTINIPFIVVVFALYIFAVFYDRCVNSWKPSRLRFVAWYSGKITSRMIYNKKDSGFWFDYFDNLHCNAVNDLLDWSSKQEAVSKKLNNINH